MNEFIELIKTVGLPMAIGITIAVIIGKYIIESKVNKLISKERLESEKKLENFKSELEKEKLTINQNFAIELENIKNELNSNFGNKEYRTISVLAEKIFKFDDMVSYYFSKDKIYEHIYRKTEPDFLTKLNSDKDELWEYFHANKMYFSNDLEERTRKIIKFVTFYGNITNSFKVTDNNFEKTDDKQKRDIYNNFVNLELKDYLSKRYGELKEFKSYFDKYEN
jgi:uncharacterized membrane-anchored protein YhcB (DUF1043 family)